MFKKYKSILSSGLLAIQLFFCSSVHGKIVTVTSHKEVAQYVKPNSLLIYDLDETLTYHNSPYFNPVAHNCREEVRKASISIAPAFYEKLISKLIKSTYLSLMEEEIPEIINNFVAQGMSVFVCTRRYHGLFGVIASYEHHTSLLVDRLSINFNFSKRNNINTNSLVIPLESKLCTGPRSCTALLCNNIFFTNENPKGPALVALFSVLGSVPKEVVFVDDLYENLVSVNDALGQKGVLVTCIHYTRPVPDRSFCRKEFIEFAKSALSAH